MSGASTILEFPLLSSLGDSVFREHHCVTARRFHSYRCARSCGGVPRALTSTDLRARQLQLSIHARACCCGSISARRHARRTGTLGAPNGFVQTRSVLRGDAVAVLSDVIPESRRQGWRYETPTGCPIRTLSATNTPFTRLFRWRMMHRSSEAMIRKPSRSPRTDSVFWDIKLEKPQGCTSNAQRVLG